MGEFFTLFSLLPSFLLLRTTQESVVWRARRSGLSGEFEATLVGATIRVLPPEREDDPGWLLVGLLPTLATTLGSGLLGVLLAAV